MGDGRISMPGKTKRNIPELLAPVGGEQQFWAAVNNGADAVYLGGPRFHAREKADNFTREELPRFIAFAHERDVKVYITFNTLLKDRELSDALDYAGYLLEARADAIIVQDMGLARMVRRHLPSLPMHLSTQGTVYNPQAADLAAELGFSRIVPARELTLDEVRRFTDACHAKATEVEVFIHGALCMCYSGQCQMSRVLGGGSARSANRGLCAQPCRLPYTDDAGRTSCFLSPKDLCLLEHLPLLCDAGVDSLKIEGRMKSPEYVAVTTSIYRKYLDRIACGAAGPVEEEDLRRLRQIYSRGEFTDGYLFGDPGEDLLSGASPKHSGIRIGEVVRVVGGDGRGGAARGRDVGAAASGGGTAASGGGASRDGVAAAARGARRRGAAIVEARLAGPLNTGDVVEIRPGGSAGSAEAAADAAGGTVTFFERLSGDRCRIGDIRGEVRPGDAIFRMTDRELLEEARITFAGDSPEEMNRRMKRKAPLRMTFTASAGAPARLAVTDGTYNMEVFSEDPVEQAHTKATDEGRIAAQLRKLGNTPFAAEEEDVRVFLKGEPAIPMSLVNGLRRKAAEGLLEMKRGGGAGLAAEDAREAGCAEAARVEAAGPGHTELGGGSSAAAGPTAADPVSDAVPPTVPPTVPLTDWLGTGEGTPEIPAVTKGRMDELIEENFSRIAAGAKDCGIVINNLGWLRQFLDAGVPVFGGRGLNVYNREARIAFAELGLRGIRDSWEAADGKRERVPLMITEHPIQSKTLTDRKGVVHEIVRAPSGDKTIIL